MSSPCLSLALVSLSALLLPASNIFSSSIYTLVSFTDHEKKEKIA
jgi:hypothetical protein